ncbi:hypothetical protein [Pontibacter sp. G13]|uniref:hypothetical protein n=1 Tax=Pontibacter sp. G13 TaxID=3074898 RepID=UPI00288C532C|nr:hypothetical protein [Pontibacter sp. G13]WNJ21327.1 hypothetical protein RJD25_12730 [Pontibacter sp. G13]
MNLYKLLLVFGLSTLIWTESFSQQIQGSMLLDWNSKGQSAQVKVNDAPGAMKLNLTTGAFEWMAKTDVLVVNADPAVQAQMQALWVDGGDRLIIIRSEGVALRKGTQKLMGMVNFNGRQVQVPMELSIRQKGESYELSGNMTISIAQLGMVLPSNSEAEMGDNWEISWGPTTYQAF